MPGKVTGCAHRLPSTEATPRSSIFFDTSQIDMLYFSVQDLRITCMEGRRSRRLCSAPIFRRTVQVPEVCGANPFLYDWHVPGFRRRIALLLVVSMVGGRFFQEVLFHATFPANEQVIEFV